MLIFTAWNYKLIFAVWNKLIFGAWKLIFGNNGISCIFRAWKNLMWMMDYEFYVLDTCIIVYIHILQQCFTHI